MFCRWGLVGVLYQELNATTNKFLSTSASWLCTVGLSAFPSLCYPVDYTVDRMHSCVRSGTPQSTVRITASS